MRNPGGYAVWTDPAKPMIERDTFTCVHCNTVVLVKPKMSPAEMGGYCAMCHAPICKHCAGKSCTPFEKKLEAAERRAIDRRALDRALSGG